MNIKSDELSKQNKARKQMQGGNEMAKKQNKLLAYVLKQLLHRLMHQFRSNCYDSNIILREMREILNDEPENHEKFECLKLWPEIELFIWALSVAPKYWINMFKHQEIYSSENQSIDMHVFTSKIYKIVIQETMKLTKYANQFSQVVSEQIFYFLEEISLQICDCFQHGRIIIQGETKKAQQLLKNSQIINFYLLYKILLQISQFCHARIIQDLEQGILRNIEHNYSEQFAHYIVEKHELLTLEMKNQQQKVQKHDHLIQMLERIKDTNVFWREAVREDGSYAILVEFQSKEGKPNENYLLKLDEQGDVEVMNCNAISMSWKVSEAAQKNYQFLNVVKSKKSLAQRLRESPTQIKQITMTDHFSTVGGSLGKCLANINKYESFGGFIFDLSKRSMISGSFNYIATNIPLIGIIFATGGYSYSFYYIFTNHISNKKKKIQELGFMTLDTASSVGSGLLGATIGQTLIPIPFLGAFIGGLVGGFVGELGGKIISNTLESIRFKETIKHLQQKIQPKGFWDVNKETLHFLGLNKQNFYNTIPPQIQGRLGADRLWYAMIGFCLLSFDESKKRAKFLEKKLKKLKQLKDNEQNFNLIFDEMKQEMEYEPSIDLLCVMKYFQSQNVNILSCYEELEEFIGLMFSRIK